MRSSLLEIESVFARMQDEAGWHVTVPMLWGYFFTDQVPGKLHAAVSRLEPLGYRTVDLFHAATNDPHEASETPLHVLHVERVELHTPMSLHARNDDFNALAEELGLASYDGWDVGPAPTPRDAVPQ